MAVKPGFEPGVQLPVRQFSKLVVSATHPLHHFQFFASASKSGAKIAFGRIIPNVLRKYYFFS
jgi:hypothetical protein